MEEKKACFVLVPLLDDEKKMKETRQYYFAIQPVLDGIKDKNNNPIYEHLLLDDIPDSGMIFNQLIEHIQHDFLAIADITNGTPLYLYLVGVRHALSKQLILIQSETDKTDLSHLGVLNIIRYGDLVKPANTKVFKYEIQKQLEAIESNPDQVDNPVSQAVRSELLTQQQAQQAQFLTMLREQQGNLTNQISQLNTLSKQIEDYTRKPLTGISQILWEAYELLNKAKEGGKFWYVGMTLGLGPPHLYRQTENGNIDEQVRSYAPHDSVAKIEEDMKKSGVKTFFEQMIEGITTQLSKVAGEAKKAKIVCLEQTDEMLKKKFINPLSKRESYKGMRENIDTVVENIITRHNKVAALVDEKNPVKYLDSIPLQFMILEKDGRRACLVFHVGTENIATTRLEGGELGFYTEIDQVIEMFVGIAESLYEAALPMNK